MEEEFQEVYSCLPFSLDHLRATYVTRLKQDGKYRGEQSTQNLIQIRIWQTVEAAVLFNLRVTMGVCAAIGQHDLLRGFLRGLDEGKELGFYTPSKGKDVPLEPKPFRNAALGNGFDLMGRLIKGLKNNEDSRMSSFLTDVADGFGHKKEFSSLGIFPPGARDDLQHLSSTRNRWTHKPREASVVSCDSWIQYHNWVLRYRFGFWKNHVLVVRKRHLAWLQRSEDSSSLSPTSVLIPPGHPLERFGEMQAVLWTPPQEEIELIGDITKVFLRGMGEYANLFPFLIAHDALDRNNPAPLAYILKIDPDKGIRTEGDIYWPPQGVPQNEGGYHPSEENFVDDKELASIACGFYSSLNEPLESGTYKWQSEHYRSISSPVRSLYRCYCSGELGSLGVKAALETLQRSGGNKPFSPSGRIGIRSEEGGIEFLFEGRRKGVPQKSSNVLLETSVITGYEEMMLSFSPRAHRPPNKRNGFITKICLNKDIGIRAWFLEESNQVKRLGGCDFGNDFIVVALEQGLIIGENEQYPFYLMEKAAGQSHDFFRS